MFKSVINMNVLKLFKPFCRNVHLSRQYYYNASDKYVDLMIDDKSGIATVTMNRPPVNSLTLEMLKELSTTFDDIHNYNCRGMILTSVSVI